MARASILIAIAYIIARRGIEINGVTVPRSSARYAARWHEIAPEATANNHLPERHICIIGICGRIASHHLMKYSLWRERSGSTLPFVGNGK